MSLVEYNGRRGVLIHHWDTDGITSAALIQKKTGGRVAAPVFKALLAFRIRTR